MSLIVLDHLTAWELTPPALIQAAAETGYDAVSLWFSAPPGATEQYPMIGDTAMRRQAIAASLSNGIPVFSVGLFVLTEGEIPDEWQGMLESGSLLGARRAIALVYDPDLARARARLATLCELASNFGIGVDVEFIAGSGLDSLAAACALVDSLRFTNCGIILDPLHLQRTGGSPADIGPSERALIRYAQLCDGPAVMAAHRWVEEGSRQRQLPGEGSFPLTEFMAALPVGIPIGLEVPLSDLAARGIGAVERSRLVLQAALPFLSGRWN